MFLLACTLGAFHPASSRICVPFHPLGTGRPLRATASPILSVCVRTSESFVCYFFVVFFAVRFAAGFVSAASAVFLAAAFLGALAGFSAGL